MDTVSLMKIKQNLCKIASLETLAPGCITRLVVKGLCNEQTYCPSKSLVTPPYHFSSRDLFRSFFSPSLHHTNICCYWTVYQEDLVVILVCYKVTTQQAHHKGLVNKV
jgi:hypothetical protein